MSFADLRIDCNVVLDLLDALQSCHPSFERNMILSFSTVITASASRLQVSTVASA
jgi:hypothetical protein